jgi:ribonucleoside-diphosphate reductase beta chain
LSNLFRERSHYKPFDYPWAYQYFKKMRKMAWEPEEVPLQEDLRDWKEKLTDFERSLLTQLFRFFTQADTNIGCAYGDVYIPAFKHPEIKMMLFSFADAEANHQDSYSQLLDTIGMAETEYQAFQSFSEMKAKHEYMFADRAKNVDGTRRSKVERMALDLAVFSAFGEGMQLFSSFAILMSFKQRNLMKGMSTIVEWSIRDESLHVEAMIKLFHTLIAENPKVWNDNLKQAIYQTCREMVELEDHFIDLVFAMGPVDGITAAETKRYIRYIADRRLMQLGLKANYGIEENPFEWLGWLMNAHTHTNFFEGRATEYSKAGVVNRDRAFDLVDQRQRSLPFVNLGVGREIVIYSKEGCPYCSILKASLTNRGVSFTEVDLSDVAIRRAFYAKTGTNSVPQLFVSTADGSDTNPSGDRIGGWQEAQKLWNL